MAITRSQIARQLLAEGGVSMDERPTESLIDPRMNRSYDENRARNEIQREMGAAVRGGNFRDFLLQNVGAGGASIYGGLYGSPGNRQGPFTGTYQSMRDSLIDQISRQRMNAPQPQPGLSERDMLPGPVGMRSLAEMDAIRKRVLAQQMNESGRTFADGRYANEAEAIADLGLERYNQLFSKGGEVSNSPGNTTLQRVLPRKGFANGYSVQDDMTDYGANVGREASPGGGFEGGDSDPTTGSTFPNLNKVTPKDVFKTSADNPNLYRSSFDRMMIQMIPGIGPAINLGEMNAFSLPQFRYSNTGGSKTRNDDDDTGDNNQIVKPMMPLVPKLPSDIEPEKSDYDEFVQRFTLPERFRLAEGGEPRQAYGLGSLVKKVTGAVKKVVKSDVGKAALAGAAIYYGGGGGNPFTAAGRSGFSFGNLGNTLGFGRLTGGEENIFAGGPFSSVANFVRDKYTSSGIGGKALLGIGAATAAAGILTPKQEEEVDSLSNRIADNTGLDIEGIRKEVQEAYASGNTEKLRTKYPFLITESAAAKAEGGRIGFENGGTYEDFEKFMMKRQESMSERQKEELRKQFKNYMRSQDPTVEAAEGGSIVPEEDEMLDMGGNEMDLRGGGFVPLGEYEKKDDVPARLSKNEFVFTADAVRAAGGGSVDRGADLMYKTMKQLENKVV